VISFAQNELGEHSYQWLLALEAIPDLVKEKSAWDAEDIALAIVFAAVQGHEPQQEALKNEFFGYIYAHCCSRRGLTTRFPTVKSIANTQDILGEVILDLLCSTSSLSFLGRDRFCTLVWMRMSWKAHRIARRKSHRSLPLFGVDDMEALSDCPFEQSVRKEDLDSLAIALGRLRKRDREIINLYFTEKTSAEIGASLGMKAAAVRKALQRALDGLALSFAH